MNQYYLDAMGIQTWRSRRSLLGAKSALNYQSYHLSTASGQKVGTLYLEEAMVDVVLSEKIFRLVDAMLFAIGLKKEQVTEQNSKQVGVGLIMGLSVAQTILNSSLTLDEFRQQNTQFITNTSQPIVITYHPLDLLKTPSDKPKAWKDLQLLFPIIDNNTSIP